MTSATGPQRLADESPAARGGGMVADPVGFHPRLLEQPAVSGELPVRGVLRFGELDVAFDDPCFGVGGVEDLMQAGADADKDPKRIELPGGDGVAVAEEPVGVEHHGAAVDLDVRRRRQPGTDEHPHRIELLEHQRVVIGQDLVDGVQAASLCRGPGELLREQPVATSCGGHAVTARG
jgi:hypothetical protein